MQQRFTRLINLYEPWKESTSSSSAIGGEAGDWLTNIERRDWSGHPLIALSSSDCDQTLEIFPPLG